MASHLTLEEREGIAEMHRAGNVQTQIADRLGRSNSTISRELRRNRSRNGYWAVAAHRKAQTRRSRRPWVGKLQRPEVRRYVRERLRRRWSPDEIAGRSRSDFPHDRRQRQGVRRTRAVGDRNGVEDLFCEAVLCVAARHEREHQRSDSPVLSQRHGSGQHPRASVYQGPASSQQPPEKTPGLSNPQRSSRLTPPGCD